MATREGCAASRDTKRQLLSHGQPFQVVSLPEGLDALESPLVTLTDGMTGELLDSWTGYRPLLLDVFDPEWGDDEEG